MPELQANTIVEDEDYESAEDEDFNPDAQPQEIESSSEEEATTTKTTRGKKQPRKRTHDKDDVIDAELDSEDDKLIANAKKRRENKKKKDGSDDGFSDDDGGEGGLIKTRAQRRQEPKERRALARTDGATVDVDALWQKLSSIPIGRPPEPIKSKTVDNLEDYIIIKRSTTFAGQTTREERRVLKSSAEARVYLAEQEAKRQKQSEKEAEEQDSRAPESASGEPRHPTRRRPLKRPSRFEPNPLGQVKGLPPHLQLRWPRDVAAITNENGNLGTQSMPNLGPATKLNTVQKSKQDWASYVDKAGIAEELDEYGKSKQSYAGRAAFLNRVDGQREEERLQAKMKAA